MRYQAIESLKILTVGLQGVPIELNGALLVFQALMGFGQQEASLAQQEVETVFLIVLIQS